MVYNGVTKGRGVYDMKEFIEQKLAECGYTNIEWHYGREGYFVLANRPNEAKSVVNISRFVNDFLWLEERKNRKCLKDYA